MDTRILRRPEVERITSLSKASIYRAMAAGSFPRPLKIGVRSVGWPEAEIRAWVATRPRANGDTRAR